MLLCYYAYAPMLLCCYDHAIVELYYHAIMLSCYHAIMLMLICYCAILRFCCYVIIVPQTRQQREASNTILQCQLCELALIVRSLLVDAASALNSHRLLGLVV